MIKIDKTIKMIIFLKPKTINLIAFDGEKIIGTSGMSFVEKPPYFGRMSGRIGLLSSMFTDSEYR